MKRQRLKTHSNVSQLLMSMPQVYHLCNVYFYCVICGMYGCNLNWQLNNALSITMSIELGIAAGCNLFTLQFIAAILLETMFFLLD